jgi:hypothetical protein
MAVPDDEHCLIGGSATRFKNILGECILPLVRKRSHLTRDSVYREIDESSVYWTIMFDIARSGVI